MDNKALRNQAYDNGTPAQQYLCGHHESGARMMAIASQYGLSEKSTYKKFVLLVGDIVLGLKPTDNVSALLTQELNLDTKTVTLLTTDIQKFMKPLKDPVWQTPNEEVVTAMTINEIESEIAETEAALETISPLRTMSSDEKKINYTASVEEKTYTSHQSAILNERKR